MKTRSLILAAFAAFAVVSCGPKVTDKTVITGEFGADAPGEVEVSINDIGVDKTSPVVDGKFSIEVPACKTSLARLKAGNIVGTFISDGTPMTVSFGEDKTVKFVSKYPKVSANTHYADFQKGMADLQKLYQPQIEAAKNDEEEDKLYDAYQADVKKLCLETVEVDKDNYTAVSAIENLQYLLDNNEMDSVLSTVDPSIAKVGSVMKIAGVVNARKATAEGLKFTDFTVGNQKLSDYVGKGKYVLVDFWASWCGPCKAELPNLKAVYAKYAGKDFDMLSVAVWDKPNATIETAKNLGIVWNQIINAQSIPTDLYGIQGIPHIILFGPDGTIVKRDLRGDDIEAEVAKHVQPVK